MDSEKSLDSNNRVKLTMPALLKSVKMPKIILERIKIVGDMLDVPVVKSNQTKCDSRQKNLDETLFEDDEFPVPSSAPKSPENGNLLKCFYCEKTFTQECHRTLHHTTHTGNKLYRLPLAKKKFVYQRNQKIREVTHSHTEQKSCHKCSYCEKTFATRSKLQIHERIHTGEKPFKCSYCNSRFNESYSLKRHERSHTGERPFKCSYCNARFISSSNLKDHESIHTGEKPYKCSICEVRFIKSSNWRRHERSHRTHSGEKPFKCSFCNIRFNASNSLKLHEQTHSREKPFKNSHQKVRQEQVSSLISQVGPLKEGSLGHLEQQEQKPSTGPIEFKCSF